jgi:hypothetical protein
MLFKVYIRKGLLVIRVFLNIKEITVMDHGCVCMFFWFFFWWDWGMNLGLCTCKQVLLNNLSHASSPFWSGYFGDCGGGPMNYLPGLTGPQFERVFFLYG